MNIVNKKLSLEEFEEYVAKKNFGSYPPTFLVMHHTFSPIEDDHDGKLEAGEWNGQKTIDALKKYYEGKGWPAGPHLFIADDGIWLFTDMYDVGIHAGDGNGSMKSGYSIGIEVVGDYNKKLWDEETKENAFGAIKCLMTRLNIAESKIMFHRDYSTKTCPGTAISKEWLINQLKAEIMEKDFVKAVEKIADKDYGDNLDSKDQKNAAGKLNAYREESEKAVSEKNIAVSKVAVLSSSLNESEAKVAEYSEILATQTRKIEDQSKKISELESVQKNGVVALGAIKLFQEAFKQIINFKI